MNEKLIAARKNKNWSQGKACNEVGVDLRTYQRWERGETTPQPFYRDKLCKVFGMSLEHLGYNFLTTLPMHSDNGVGKISPSTVSIGLKTAGVVSFDEQRDWASWFGQKIAQIFRVVSSCNDPISCDAIQTIVEQEIRMMDETLEQYQVQQAQSLSRRQALATIAALPLAIIAWRSSATMDTISPEFLPQCAASITACWQLLRGQGGLSAVNDILPQFTPLLRTLAQRPSSNQKVAARLAAQTSILQAVLTMHQLNFTAREAYCKDAVRYASLAEDNNLRASALTYLGYTYSFCYVPRKPEKAIQVFLEALQDSSEEVPLLRCNIQMGLAEAYAQCKDEQQALHYIHLAQTNFPAYPEQDPSYIFGDCSLHVLYQWEGKMYLELVEHYADRGYQQKAATALLRGTGVQSISERSTTETVIYQADASRVLGELDMYTASLRQAAQMASDLGSRKRFNEAALVYQKTPQNWIKERHIQILAKDVFGYLPGRM